MKKIVKLLLASGILVSSLSGCKKAYEGKFVLGLDASFPPMGFTEADGTITGYDIDLAKEVSKRLNLANEKDTVLEVEKKLMKKIPKNKWSRVHHQLVLFGRYTCKSIKPECEKCLLKEHCKYYKKINKKI